MIDRCPLRLGFRPTVVSCRLLTSYYFSLNLFSCFRDISYATLSTLAVIDLPV
jgi:hypothetical protein